MTDQRHLLKIKLKSLAAESRIIRQAENKLQLPRVSDPGATLRLIGRFFHKNNRPTPEEAKALRLAKRAARAKFRESSWYGDNRAMLQQLQRHRRLELRSASRASLLAYGYLRGKTLQQIEGNRGWLNEISAGDRWGHETFVDRPIYAEAFKLARRYGVKPTPQTLDEIETSILDWFKAGGIAETLLPKTSSETIKEKISQATQLSSPAGPALPGVT